MKTNLKYVQWLLFWFSACLPACLSFTLMAAELAAPAVAPARDFSFAEPEFETLHDAEAIDNQAITTLVQDARGLIWIGTQAGLVRYDGYHFRKFVHNADDPFSLAGNYVRSLSVAKNGRLWVGTASDGISVFDPASERFENYRHDARMPDSLDGGVVWATSDDGHGGMWIATNQGLDHLPEGGKRFAHFRHGTGSGSLIDNKVRSLLRDREGRLWVGSTSGLQRLSPDGKHFETVVAGMNVLALFQARDGKLWLGTAEHGAAWLIPGVTPSQVHWLPVAQLSNTWITGIAQVNADQIWLASYGGGIIVAAASDGQVLQTLRHDPALAGSLNLDALTPLMLDRAGCGWALGEQACNA